MMALPLTLLFAVAQSTKFVSYIGQAGPGWANPGTNENFLKYIGVPGYGGDLGYNVLNFAFWVSTSTNGGAAVNGAAYDWQNIENRITDSSLIQVLTGKSSATAAELRAGIKAIYAQDGIDICISAFGGADHPMGNGANAVTTAQALYQYGIDYDYDCYDIDWEEAYCGKFGATAYGEQWLCDLTDELYSLKSADQYITHAPQAPYFMGTPQYPLGGYTTVHKNCGDKISWYNVQFYNQGSTRYDTYSSLFVNSDGWSANTAVYEIMDGASSENVPVPAEKIVVGKHTFGDGSSFVSGSTLKSIFNSALADGRWSTGFMTWQLYTEIASTDRSRETLIGEVLQSNWIPTAPTPPTTARPTSPPSTDTDTDQPTHPRHQVHRLKALRIHPLRRHIPVHCLRPLMNPMTPMTPRISWFETRTLRNIISHSSWIILTAVRAMTLFLEYPFYKTTNGGDITTIGTRDGVIIQFMSMHSNIRA